MGNILLISENDALLGRYKNMLAKYNISINLCHSADSVSDTLTAEPADIIIIDGQTEHSNSVNIIKQLKSTGDNIQILFIKNNSPVDESLARYINGYLFESMPDDDVTSVINVHLNNKQYADNLTEKNKTLADSLYRLNVLYSTSSQFAGTLDIKKLIEYMTEGLDKSLSFDLTCTISIGFENEPVLIINSLYDVSEELINALKFRTILNYKSLFENMTPPFEINDKNLKVIKVIKNPTNKFNFSIFQYDNMFAPIDLGDNFFGCIEIFREKQFSADDATYFQTIVQQVSLPLKSAGLYNQIIEKNEELEKLERIKSEFISIVSHELRTPLTPIKNALSILSGGKGIELPENAMKFVDMAKRNVDDLTNIINDILDINKIEANKMDFNYSLMNIHSVIENVKTNYDLEAKKQGINLSTQEQDNLPEIYADSQRLGQVLKNLVSNAIKFTPEGKSITIKSELKNADNINKNSYFENDLKSLNGDYVVVSVVDEGIGIKSNDILKVFDKFTQIENSLSRKVGGTGLGLPIAKRLVKAHNGAIWCDSEENKGSSFYVAIPVHKSDSDS